MAEERELRIDEKYRCTARAKSTGYRCRRPAVPGLKVCRFHGGNTKAGRAAGQRNLAIARVGMELARRDIPFEDPLEGLLIEVARSSHAVKVLGDLVAELEKYPNILVIEADVASSEEDGADEGEEERQFQRYVPSGIIGPDHLGDMGIHPYVQLWNKEREWHAKVCKLALEAGVAERQVRLAEQQGELMAKIIEQTLGDPEFGLTHEQRSLGKRVAAKHLRAVPETA